MNEKLNQSQKLLHDSLFELYMQGGLELYLVAAHGMKRNLIIELETSALTPENGEIIHFYAVNRWDEDDVFDEYARPQRPLSPEAERILGFTNDQLADCRTTDQVAELTDRWQAHGLGLVPRVPLRLLQRLYAQLLQEQAFGGLTAAVLKELDSVSPEAGKGRAPTPPPPRHGHQIRLVIAGEGRASKPASKPAPKPEPQRDAKLAALLAEAYAARQLVLDNPETPLADLAKQHGKCRKHLARMVELSCLAPDIVTAILEGKQPRSLSAASLRSRQLPLSWEEQRAALLEAWIRCLHPA